MRGRDVEVMAAEPQIRALRRSERDVWCYLARQADDDGVVRRYIATRHLAGKTGYSFETVRKAVHRLERLQLLRCIPGNGRTCSLYAVPRALSTTIMQPEAPVSEARRLSVGAADPPDWLQWESA
jgi:DNA-binding transcriptional MocR family regulator